MVQGSRNAIWNAWKLCKRKKLEKDKTAGICSQRSTCGDAIEDSNFMIISLDVCFTQLKTHHAKQPVMKGVFI